MNKGTRTDIDCPNCQEGLVVKIKGKYYCEDCNHEIEIVDKSKGDPLTSRERNLIEMACIMKIRHFQEDHIVKTFGPMPCENVINEYQAIIAKVAH